MPYGIIKVDQVTFTNAGVDQTISVSGIVASISGNITATGTISGNVIRGGTTISGATVTGTAGQFGTITGNTAGFTTVTGTTVTGATATFTSGVFTNISGGTHTITSGVFASGTAANPSITFQGDVNTGIYSPGADQVAISTDGAGRAVIGSTGRLGLGTLTPGTKIDIVAEDNTSLNPVLRVNSNNVAVNTALAYDGLIGNSQLTIGNTSANPIVFNTNSSEKVRITSAGLVGVGNSSPGSYNASSDDLVIGDHVGAHGVTICSQNNSSGYIMFADGTTGAQTYAGQITYDHTNNRLTLGTNDGTTGLTIDSSQRVGIGTQTPSSLLHVQGSASNIFRVTTTDTGASNILSINNNDNFNYGIIGVTSGNGTAGGDVFGAGYTSVLTSDFTPVINWTSQGRVGIGITPAAQLDVRATSGTLFRCEYTGVAQLNIGNGGNSINYYDANSQIFRNGAGSSEYGRWDTSGRLLVGTSNYSGNSAFVIKGGAAQNVGLVDVRYGTTRPTTADVQVSEIRFGSTDFTSNSAYANIQCVTDGVSSSDADIPGRLVFSTTADGASSPTPRMRIGSNGTTATFASVTGGQTVLDVAANVAADATNYLIYGSHSATGFQAGTASFYVFTNGNVRNTNNSYGAISDSKLKENIADALSQWEDIKNLRVRKYNFKKETGQQTHTQIGLIAQEVELVSPGLVSESPDRDEDGNDLGTVTKSVNYSVLYMKAVKALQEAMDRIEQLETEKTEQQTVLDNLLARVAALEAA